MPSKDGISNTDMYIFGIQPSLLTASHSTYPTLAANGWYLSEDGIICIPREIGNHRCR